MSPTSRRHFFSAIFRSTCSGLLLALCLTACDSSDSGGKLPLNYYESDAGEAAVRHLISKLPEINPGVAKSYSVVLGEITNEGMTPASAAFTARFADLNLKFVNALNLTVVPPDHIIADPDTRLAVFVLQLRSLKQTSATTWDAEVSWSYKKELARYRVKLDTQDSKVVVVADEKLETK